MLQGLAPLIRSMLPPTAPLSVVVNEVPIWNTKTACELPPPSSVRLPAAIEAEELAWNVPEPNVPVGHARLPVAPQLVCPELTAEKSGVPGNVTVAALPAAVL